MRGKENSGGCKRCCIRITPAYAGKSLPKSWRNMTQKGSPPPMRGKEYRRYLRRNERGITPAYAGKRAVSGISLALTWDHPRLCGEKGYSSLTYDGHQGSPPPMRGKAVPVGHFCVVTRITPAYAGKSAVFRRIPPSFQDHPRLCGEKALAIPGNVLLLGSPPPMRGKVWQVFDTLDDSRITPAYAGKSFAGNFAAEHWQDHPRLCGEKEQRVARISVMSGSPPPMRGKAAEGKYFFECTRITPAYAGKRRYFLSLPAYRRDHPRLCGEKADTQISGKTVEGSPPPMRGKALKTSPVQLSPGITPAYAGKSEKARNCVVFTGDHPRLCGEKIRMHEGKLAMDRITPAYAGKS